MKVFRLITRLAGIVVICACVGVSLTIYACIDWIPSKQTVEIDITPGLSVAEIASQLKTSGVIVTPKVFSLWVKLAGIEGKLKAGFYRFDAGLTLRDVADKIKRGDVIGFSFTVVEGWNVHDIVHALSEAPFISDPTIIDEVEKLMQESALEGYIFPDTYRLTYPRSAADLVRELSSRFWKEFSPEYKSRADELGMTVHHVMTLASVVEKETGAPEERALIASVFHNRLKKGMLLQSDPTVIYGLKGFDGNLRKHDLSNPHPYNTYVHKGLPPGPIANPGKAAIEATLYPADTKYLYFVSRNDGTHKFSETLSEHLKAVMEYQVRRSQQGR